MKKTSRLALPFFFECACFAQTRFSWDTLRYEKINSSFTVAYFQSCRDFRNDFEPVEIPDSLGVSKNNYNAESRLISGLEIIYDKFSFAVALRSKPPNKYTGKGNTKTFKSNRNFGGNIWYFQNTFRYFKGFYDNNTDAYDTTIRQTREYYKRLDLENVLFRSKFLYFTHYRKCAFRAGYADNYRQLKSGATWILSANINYYWLRSDSSFFALQSQPFYNDYGSLRGPQVLGLSANAGAAGTLVILKSLFINAMFILGTEQQWRTYTYDDRTFPLSYISVSGALRFSIGINLRRFYLPVNNTNDFVLYNSSFVGLLSSSISGGITFGWRFYSEVPEFHKKFQKNKIL